MKHISHLLLTLIFLLSSLVVSSVSLAHEGHDKAPGEDSDSGGVGPISITLEAKKNLNLTVEEVEVRTLDKTLTALGAIEPVPGRAAAISSRILGKVSALHVNDGQKVKKGQQLVEVESRQLGDPPPRVAYVAPFDGVVTDRHAVLGDTVEPEKHLMEVVDLDEVYAEGRIYEGQVSEVTVSQKARVTVESFPKETFEGKLELISGALDPETRTLKVWVRLSNKDLKLRPNMRATLQIVVAESESAIAIPHSAVLGDLGNKFVFVQSDTDEQVFERRQIVIGTKDDRYVEVLEGIFPGDKVVTSGNYQLQYIAPKAKEEKDSEESSHEEKAAPSSNALIYVGGLVSILLVLNAALLLRSKKQFPKEMRS